MESTNRPLDACEIAAWRDFYAAAPPDIRTSLGIEIHEVSDATAFFVSQSNVLALNRTLGLGMSRAPGSADLDRIVALFREKSAHRMFLQMHPGAVSTELRTWFAERGLRHYNNWYKLYHRLNRIPPTETDLRIETIGPEFAATFGSIAAASFDWPEASADWIGALVGRPGWRHFMAFDGQHAVATGAMMITGDEAWLDFAATLPSHRSRGAQSALIAKRLVAARNLGCRRAQVETAEPRPDKIAVSLRNVRRMGFDVAYRRANYILERTDTR